MEMVTVGNRNNAADDTGYGSVAQEFLIGKYEVTNAQYCAFLNAVAKTDTYALYHTKMGGTAAERGGILRSGSSGSYVYSVRSDDWANKPVNFVSWFDALRFCNWLHNGQGSGSTETGAYTMSLIDGTSTVDVRNEGAKYWLPSEDEWYKAAYYDPNKGGVGVGGYWDYPTKSDSAPKNTHANSAGDGDGYWDSGTSGDWIAWASATTTNVANYKYGADWNGLDGNVTTVGTNGGPSAYLAFDLGGNIREWNEVLDDSSRGARGGNWDSDASNRLLASYRSTNDPTSEGRYLGFRVASMIPEPGSITLLVCGVLAVLLWWWRRR